MQKTYIIAGGSSGIGYELSNILLDEGHEVIVLSRSRKLLNESIMHHIVDFSSETILFPNIDKPVSGLVYLPGSILLKPFKSLTKADYVSDFQLNVIGFTETLKKYLPLLTQSGSGSIVTMSSVAVTIGMPYHSVVSASKGAIEGLTRNLAAELSPGIRVNAIAPSLTETPMADKFLNSEDKRKVGRERHPLNKIGNAKDMAYLIAYLLSEKSGFITGQIIKADGGMSSIKKF